jgi:hypothetical protein
MEKLASKIKNMIPETEPGLVEDLFAEKSKTRAYYYKKQLLPFIANLALMISQLFEN